MPLNDLGGRLGIKHRGLKPRSFQLERRQVFRPVKAYRAKCIEATRAQQKPSQARGALSRRHQEPLARSDNEFRGDCGKPVDAVGGPWRADGRPRPVSPALIAFTHKSVLGDDPVDTENRRLIAAAVNAGFTINLSADNPAHADKLAELGWTFRNHRSMAEVIAEETNSSLTLSPLISRSGALRFSETARTRKG